MASPAEGPSSPVDAALADGEEAVGRREIGRMAVWSVTSAKPGNGVELLRDDNFDTYWQSDGAQPHLVNIQFQKKVSLLEVGVYTDFKHDESYTPSKLSIRVGHSYHDLREVKQVDVGEVVGWIPISLRPPDPTKLPFTRAYLVQLAVLANHQNGRDTHIRQIRIYGPRPALPAVGPPLGFSTPEFGQFAALR